MNTHDETGYDHVVQRVWAIFLFFTFAALSFHITGYILPQKYTYIYPVQMRTRTYHVSLNSHNVFPTIAVLRGLVQCGIINRLASLCTSRCSEQTIVLGVDYWLAVHES
jgi:hypothetical protein